MPIPPDLFGTFPQGLLGKPRLLTLPQLSNHFKDTPLYSEMDVLRWARQQLITTFHVKGRKCYDVGEVGRRLGA